MTSRPPFAILASGNGTNAQALIDAAHAGVIDADVACVLSDVPGAPVLARAAAQGVEALVVDPLLHAHRADYETTLVRELHGRGVEHVVLAGYLRICGATFLAAYGGRTINVHPSLLPAFPGRDAISAALAAGVRETGVTVHFIDEGVDTGPVICRQSVPVIADDTRDTLAARLRPVEHRLLVQITRALVRGELAFPGTIDTTKELPCLVP